MPTWWSAVPKGSPHPQQCGCRLQGRRWWDLASESKTIQGQDRRKRIAFGGLWKGRLKSISSRFRETPPAGRPTNCEPSGAGRSWKGGARERADDVFFATGIKRRRSKADFAPTWKGRLKSIFLNGEKCRPQGGPPTASPAQRVAVGKEEQGSGRMTSFLP